MWKLTQPNSTLNPPLHPWLVPFAVFRISANFHFLSPVALAKNLGFILVCNLCLTFCILSTRKSCWLYHQNESMLCALLWDSQAWSSTKNSTQEWLRQTSFNILTDPGNRRQNRSPRAIWGTPGWVRERRQEGGENLGQPLLKFLQELQSKAQLGEWFRTGYLE